MTASCNCPRQFWPLGYYLHVYGDIFNFPFQWPFFCHSRTGCHVLPVEKYLQRNRFEITRHPLAHLQSYTTNMTCKPHSRQSHLTFAVVWDPETGLEAYSGSDLRSLRPISDEYDFPESIYSGSPVDNESVCERYTFGLDDSVSQSSSKVSLILYKVFTICSCQS